MTKIHLRILTAILGVAVATSTSSAQVSTVFLGKGTSYVQTDDTTVTPNNTVTATSGGAYSFGVTVSGTGLSAPTVSLAAGSTQAATNTSAHNGGVLGFNSDDDAWEYGSPNFNNWGATSASEIDTLFANGDYTVSSPDFDNVTLTLNTPTNALNIPLLTLSGGMWSGGVYWVNPGATVTITSNAFTAFGGNVNGHISFHGWNDSNGASILSGAQEIDRFYTDNTTDTITSSITADTLISGQTYIIEAGFSAVVDSDSVNVSSVPVSGALAGAFWEYSTRIQISAVPEPSTYAAIVGILCLGIVMWRRRKLG